MKRFLFACNFKMNIVDVKEYKKAMNDETFDNVILCPNFCDLKDFAKLKKSNKIRLGAQNVCETESGARTGEVSAKMISNVGVQFCIVGHSERKQNNFETYSQINNKIKMLLNCNITPIICVGEDLYSKQELQTEYAKRFVLSELNEILQDVDIQKIIIAYEPIWAIGTGKVASKEHIKSVLETIKKYVNVPLVLYGGSFNESNFKDIASIDVVDGALIGGASLKPESICKMKKELDKLQS